ncbi:MAG: hypothetical protein ACKPKO_41175, partial [Candidatus Fonsibacter sp.]
LMTTSSHERYANVLEQSKSIAELLLECQGVDWKDFDMNKFVVILEYIKSMLNTTNATNDISNIIIC